MYLSGIGLQKFDEYLDLILSEGEKSPRASKIKAEFIEEFVDNALISEFTEYELLNLMPL